MRTVRGVQNLAAPLERTVVSIGNFDGLHRGHRAILARGLELARERGAELVVVTFEPHPLSVVAPERAPATLTPLDEKLRCLESVGVYLTLVLESTHKLLTMSPHSFIRELVVPNLRATHLVEGRSFGFGRGRRGNVETLAELGGEFGFEVVVVPPVQFLEDPDPERVSSSLVRRLLSTGRVAAAARCMGRRYALFGTVVGGRGRGHELGFPTANLKVGGQLVPAEGVYSAFAILSDEARRSIPAAVSIGHTPTFDDMGLMVEAHLLDFDEQLGGTAVRLEFVSRLRGQRRFTGPRELSEQIRRDVQQVRVETDVQDPAAGAPVEAAS